MAHISESLIWDSIHLQQEDIYKRDILLWWITTAIWNTGLNLLFNKWLLTWRTFSDTSSSDTCNRHLLLLANFVEKFHVLNYCIRWIVDAVMLIIEHRGDTGGMISHKALHELHYKVPTVSGYHTWTIVHLTTITKKINYESIIISSIANNN